MAPGSLLPHFGHERRAHTYLWRREPRRGPTMISGLLRSRQRGVTFIIPGALACAYEQTLRRGRCTLPAAPRLGLSRPSLVAYGMAASNPPP